MHVAASSGMAVDACAGPDLGAPVVVVALEQPALALAWAAGRGGVCAAGRWRWRPLFGRWSWPGDGWPGLGLGRQDQPRQPACSLSLSLSATADVWVWCYLLSVARPGASEAQRSPQPRAGQTSASAPQACDSSNALAPLRPGRSSAHWRGAQSGKREILEKRCIRVCTREPAREIGAPWEQ